MLGDDGMRRVPDSLDELVALVESARGLPLSASCVLPREHVLDLLDELRAALPPALEDAREVLIAREELLGQARDRRDRAVEEARAETDRVLSGARAEAQRVLSGARAEADRLLAAARADAERMVSLDGVRRTAEAEARGVLEAARQRADRMRAEADAYADERLATLEETLGRLLGTVQRGRELLSAAVGAERGPAARPPSPRGPNGELASRPGAP